MWTLLFFILQTHREPIIQVMCLTANTRIWLMCFIQLLNFHSIVNAQCDGSTLELFAEDTWQTQSTPRYNTDGIGSNAMCSWTIKQSESGTGVAFTVHDIDPTLASPVKITMYRGNITDDANRIIITAAETIYDIIRVDNNDAHITVETGTTANQKFQITFFTPTDQSVSCSSVMYAEEIPNILSSPNFPDYYPDNYDCTWEFSSGSPLAVITFKFIWINIQNRSPCIDFVAIHNGKPSDNLEATVKFCPSMNLNNKDYLYSSTLEYAYIKFHSDMFVSRSGFFIEYTSDNTGTVVESTFETATVLTPGFETNFMAYLDYKLTITDATGITGVKLLIGMHDVDVPCTTGAKVNVYDDNTDADASKILLQDVCGENIPATFKATGSALFLRFRTADNTAGKGFKVSYISYKESTVDNSATQFVDASDIVNFLSTQGFPSMYPSDTNNVYVISSGHASSSVSVIVVFIDFAPPCTADYLNIYDGNRDEDTSLPIVQAYCSSTSSWSETTHISTGQYVSVLFISDAADEKSGFLLKYWVERQCPGSGGFLAVTSKPQILFSPGYTESSYPTFLQCNWTLTKTSGQIMIEFTDFTCGSGDWLTVFDGADNTATTLVDNLCVVSSSTFGPVVSSSESLYVEFNTERISYKGFAMKYVGGPGDDDNTETKRLTATREGIILSSPLFPMPYPSDISRTYIISSGHVATPVTVAFLFLDINNSPTATRALLPDCSGDKLEIYESDVIGADTLLSRICTDSATWSDTEVSSTGQSLSVVFTTNTDDDGRGFVIKYSIEPHCPVTMTNLTADFEPGVLMTPGYEEGSYPLFLDCSWNISTNFVGIDILSELDIASIPCDSESSVSIYDGLDTDGVLLQGNLCGSDLKVVKIGESGSLHITYVTDEYTAKGFALKYMAAKDNSGTGVVQQLDATTDKQYISSALFPMAYPSGETRTYVVSSGHSSSHVIMNVVYVNISPSCTDSLEIFDGDQTVDAGVPSLVKFCSNDEKWPEQVNHSSTGQYLTAVFTALTGDEGFFLHYYVLYHCPDETHDITANSFPGELKSPGYDDGSHPTYLECAWTVTARVQGTPVLLQMVDVGLGTGAGVSIYDGSDINGILLQKLSGIGQNHPMIIAESGTAFLKLRTEATSEARGFLLKYMASRDMSVTSHVTTLDEDQYLSSTSFPHLYPGTDNRVWVISTADPEKIVNISILFMDVVDSSECTGGDALKIYDGEYMVGMEYSPTVIDVVCREGSWSTIEYQSTGQYISLVFELDSVSSNNRHGYLLAYKHIDDLYPWVCVGGPQSLKASLNIATIQSPGFADGGTYSRYLDCTWTISAEMSDMKILFQVTEMNVPCSTNAGLFVFDGSDQQSPSLLQYVCGSSSLLPMASSSDSLFIQLKTGDDTSGTGFKMMYIAADDYSGNGDIIIASSEKQYVSSPLFPAKYSAPATHIWIISSPSWFDVVAIEIVFMDIFKSTDCRTDSLAIYDGEYGTKNSPRQVANICNQTDWEPAFYTSTSQYLSLVLKTKNMNSHGFLTKYWSISGSDGDGGGQELWSCPTETRLYAAETVMKIVTSPGYENNNNEAYINCDWTITVETGWMVLMDIEVDIPCNTNADFSVTSDTDASASYLLKYECGEDKDFGLFKSASENIYLRFRRQESTASNGFRVKYIQTKDYYTVERWLPADQGQSFLSSKYFPLNYHESVTYKWLISSGSIDDIVVTEIIFVDIQSTEECLADSLVFYDDAYGDKEIARLCSEQNWTAKHVISSDQYMTVVFTSDDNTEKSGFLLSYTNAFNPKGNKNMSEAHRAVVGVAGAISACLALATFSLMVALYRRSKGIVKKSSKPFELYDLSRAKQKHTSKKRFEEESSYRRNKPYDIYDEARANENNLSDSKHWHSFGQNYGNNKTFTPKWIKMMNSKN